MFDTATGFGAPTWRMTLCPRLSGYTNAKERQDALFRAAGCTCVRWYTRSVGLRCIFALQYAYLGQHWGTMHGTGNVLCCVFGSAITCCSRKLDVPVNCITSGISQRAQIPSITKAQDVRSDVDCARAKLTEFRMKLICSLGTYIL